MSSNKTNIPGLGAFGRQGFARELRDIIYDFATITDADEEVDITTPCGPSVSLLRASKIICAETQAIIAPKLARPCEHTEFLITLPTLTAYPEATYHDNLIPSLLTNTNKRLHNLLQAKKMRFLTGHLGKDVPLAVIVKLDLPEKCTVEVFGASTKRHAKVMDDLEYLLETIVGRAKKVAACEDLSAAPLVAIEKALLEKEVVNIAEWVREVVLDRDGED